jgi:hypothetical protein
MTAPTITRRPITAAAAEAEPPAERLFTAAPARRAATISMQFKGVPVAVALENASAAEVEKLIDSLLAREGWSGAAPTASGPARPQRREKPPEVTRWSEDGSPLCPVHTTPMKESQHNGWYCPKKTEDGAYCRCRA